VPLLADCGFFMRAANLPHWLSSSCRDNCVRWKHDPASIVPQPFAYPFSVAAFFHPGNRHFHCVVVAL
jgi:hypothetical protein